MCRFPKLFGKHCVRSLIIAHYVFDPSWVWSNNLQNHTVGISSVNHESSAIPLSTSQNSETLKNYKKTLGTVSKWRLFIWLSNRVAVTAIRSTGDDIWRSMWLLVSDSDRSVSRPRQVKGMWSNNTGDARLEGGSDQIAVSKILNGHENIDPSIFFKI